uniref:Serpin domain-containing protein n=1 Tax=Canis lupus familiaris TaxID=9615 RepID=A0A8C0RXJ0_CANLF
AGAGTQERFSKLCVLHGVSQRTMPSSIPWVLLLLAGLCYQVPGSLLAPRQDHSLHQHGRFPNIATKLDNFAFSLYRRLAPKSNNNIFFSPVSIATAFTKLSLGTKGNTGTQILQGLDFNFKETAKANTHNFQLTSTSVLFMDKNLKQVHEFLEDVTKLYHFSVNFRDTEEATKQINQYIEKGTQGKIVDLVQDLDRDTTLILDNFKFEHIVEGNFYVSENTKIKVLMMSRLGMFDLHWGKELSSWLLRQSCQGRVSAFLILPNLRKRQQLESKLAKEVLAKFLEKRQARSASLRLPKLSISGTYDLKSVLSKMGITKVFSTGLGSGISKDFCPSVSSLQAMHKAMLSIDENVTEYSGVIPSEENTWSKHLSILFNWPFLVIIKDENTNIPLFMGKMVNPMQK